MSTIDLVGWMPQSYLDEIAKAERAKKARIQKPRLIRYAPRKPRCTCGRNRSRYSRRFRWGSRF